MTKSQYAELSAPMIRTMQDMEDDVLRLVVKQLIRDGDFSDTSKWRIRQLTRTGDFDKAAAKLIASYSGTQSKLLAASLRAAALTETEYLDNAVKAAAKQGLLKGYTDLPAETSALNAVKAYQKQAKSNLNLVNTVMRYKAKDAFVKAVNNTYFSAKERQRVLDTMGKHTASAVMGQVSLQEAVRGCIKELAAKGIPAFVDKLGREWSPEAYVSMDLRTTLANTAREAQNTRCDQYGISLIAVDSHAGARPLCEPYQGRIFSRDGSSGTTKDGSGRKITYKPLSSTSYGKPAGLFGINCGHTQYPFIPGVNIQRYFPYEKEENDKRYKEFQQQRRMERDIRTTKRECMLLDEVGDKEGFTASSVKLKAQRTAYAEYCDTHGLTTHSDRTQVYGFDRSVSSKSVWANRKAAEVTEESVQAVKKVAKPQSGSSGSAVSVDVSAGKIVGNTGKTYVEEKVLDNFADSGIIEDSIKDTPITVITEQAIEKVPYVKIDGYTDEQCKIIQEQHKELLRYSHENNEDKEVAFVLDGALAKKKTIVGSDSEIEFDGSIYGKDLLLLHNHPRNGGLSYSDVAEFVGNDSIKTMTVVKNNGNVETSTKQFSLSKKDELLLELERLKQKRVKTGSDGEYRVVVNKFLSKHSEKGEILWQSSKSTSLTDPMKKHIKE